MRSYWFKVYCFARDSIEFYLVKKCLVHVILGCWGIMTWAVSCAHLDPVIALSRSPAPCQPHFVSFQKGSQASGRTHVHKADVIGSLLAHLSILSLLNLNSLSGAHFPCFCPLAKQFLQCPKGPSLGSFIHFHMCIKNLPNAKHRPKPCEYSFPGT